MTHPDSGAIIEGIYRYELWRHWDYTRLPVKWIMLNPSTADAREDDPTIRKCIKFAKTWGYGGIRVVNLFAFRATDPKELKVQGYGRVVGPKNNAHIISVLGSPGLNVAAWGQGGKLWSRALIVREEVLERHGIELHALKLAKDGVTPYHPLYLKDDSLPFRI